jgi:hypothetical protein
MEIAMMTSLLNYRAVPLKLKYWACLETTHGMLPFTIVMDKEKPPKLRKATCMANALSFNRHTMIPVQSSQKRCWQNKRGDGKQRQGRKKGTRKVSKKEMTHW